MKKIEIIIQKCFIILLVLSCTTSALPVRKTTLNQDFISAGHLVFIGLDGLGSFYLSKANMPTVKRMIHDGSSSMEARSVMPSISWPNWSSLFMGTPPEKQTEYNYFSIFSLVKNSNTILYKGSETLPVLFYEWEDLYYICQDKDAIKLKISSDYESAYKIASYILANKPVFTAVVFGEPDTTGHSKGWGSKAYYEKLTILDNFISIIEQSIRDSGIHNNTVFVFSSDHGGSFKGHGRNTSKHRKIPLIFYGPGINNNYNIPFSPDIFDIAPTMAAILGLHVPIEWTGRPIFEIFD